MDRKRAKEFNGVIDEARYILNHKNRYVIQDTETTGLDKNDVIIQIGVLDLDGNILLDSLVKPTKRKKISTEATAIHGITMDMLEDAPTFEYLFPKFLEALGNKTLITYNAKFESRMVSQTLNQEGSRFRKEWNGWDAMIAYSVYVGEWSEFYQDYKYQKLPGADHTAIGDCKATLDVIHKIANSEKVKLPKRWWEYFYWE